MANRFVPILQDHAPAEPFDLDKLADEWGILIIHLLATDGTRVRLVFDDYRAYRKRDEGDALRMLNDAKGALGRSFYRVEGSEFLEWFHAENYDTWRDRPLTHIVIMTIDDIIDVICRSEPRIETN